MGGPCEVLVEIAEESASAQGRRSGRCLRLAHRGQVQPLSSDDNIVARINALRGRPVEVDNETANLLDFAALMHRLSDGLFDITSGVLRRAWTFDGGHRVPTREEIDALLPLVGWSKRQLAAPRDHFATRHANRLRRNRQGIRGGSGDRSWRRRSACAAVLVNFGGDLAVTRARDGDRPWRVGIEGIDPAADAYRALRRLVDLAAGALATSGDTYRFVESKRRRLPHILDPRDGCPVRDAPRSVTVAAPLARMPACSPHSPCCAGGRGAISRE